jgi:hypothetical protein
MKLLTILFAFLLVLPVSLATRYVPVSVDVSVDFRGEHSFVLLLPNGFERQFVWDNGTQHSDASFSSTMYWALDENTWCTDNSALGEYRGISGNLTKMIDICGNVVSTWNQTDDLRKRAADAEKDREIYNNMYTICEGTRKDAVNKSADCASSLTLYKGEAENCQTRLTSCQKSSGEVSDLQSQLSQALSSKNNWGMGGLILGLAAGYFIWGRKKGGVPSEHERFGVRTDAPSEIDQRTGRFSDGPRQ